MRKQKKVKKYLIEHPEILEAMQQEMDQYSEHRIDDNDIPSFEDFLSRHELIAQHYREYKSTEVEPNIQKAKPQWYRRKSLIAVATALIIIIIFSLTPMGQAFASNIYKTVVNWFDGGVNIQHGQSDSSGAVIEPQTEYFSSIEEISSKYDISVIYNRELEKNDDFKVETTDKTLVRISANYLIGDHEISLIQTVYFDNTEWDTNISFDDGQSIDYTTNDSIRFLGYVEENSGYAIAYQDNMSIEVFSEKIDYNEMISFIKGLSVEEIE